ncbi:MAG: 2,3-bisphosphoglycerate-independent phosphoglycerate mutase [Eubacteriales bacterium]|nr:2,3-bisphosphoglycerate-independent phosphoglycerate mutase [Eubacteriales bacterium]
MKKINAIIIMDGFGVRKDHKDNAIIPENIPNLEKLIAKYPFTTIQASGLDVGLPVGQMGNSEVGHLNIGAGRIVYQELTRITKSIEDGDFFENEALVQAVEAAKTSGKKLHLMGLMSDGGVHSHIDHVEGLLRLAKQHGMERTYVHCFMDGRDTPPSSGKGYLEDLNDRMEKVGCGKVATVMGRYWAMDRDKRWDRVKRAYDAMVLGEGETAACPICAIQNAYDRDETDEFVAPTVITKDGKPLATVEEGDSIIFFNFRPDRARQITRAFIEPDFADFERAKGYFPVNYVSMTQYDATFANLKVAFKPQKLENTLGEYLSAQGKTQLRIAETEKYAHVTFFFNGGVEQANPGEDRCLIASPKVATYDLQSEMSAPEVARQAVERINSGNYDVMILNFANCDMVGHTGVFDAAWKAVHTVDTCVQQVVDAILAQGGSAIITADHGNAEMMVDPETGAPFTAHTTNPVPFLLVGQAYEDAKLRADGRLADLAPTLLDMMGLEKPAEMTGTTMLAK